MNRRRKEMFVNIICLLFVLFFIAGAGYYYYQRERRCTDKGLIMAFDRSLPMLERWTCAQRIP